MKTAAAARTAVCTIRIIGGTPSATEMPSAAPMVASATALVRGAMARWVFQSVISGPNTRWRISQP